MASLRINMGNRIPVYNYAPNGSQIGFIGKGEFYIEISEAGGDGVFVAIDFINSKGVLTQGELYNPLGVNMTRPYDSKYRYGTRLISGTRYNLFNVTRRSLPIYSVSGRRIGTVAAGQQVALTTPVHGNRNPSWLRIHYASKTSGGWDKITGDGEGYGFVDTGFPNGFKWNTIPLDGLWSPHF